MIGRIAHTEPIRVVSLDDSAINLPAMSLTQGGKPYTKNGPLTRGTLYLLNPHREDLLVIRQGQMPTWFTIRQLSPSELRAADIRSDGEVDYRRANADISKATAMNAEAFRRGVIRIQNLREAGDRFDRGTTPEEVEAFEALLSGLSDGYQDEIGKYVLNISRRTEFSFGPRGEDEKAEAQAAAAEDAERRAHLEAIEGEEVEQAASLGK